MGVGGLATSRCVHYTIYFQHSPLAAYASDVAAVSILQVPLPTGCSKLEYTL